MALAIVMGGVTVSSRTALSCGVDGASHRHFTQMLSGVDGLYTFPPSLCNQSVRVIRILVNSHVDLCLLSSTRVPRLSSAPGDGGVDVMDGVVDGAVVTVMGGAVVGGVNGASHRHGRRGDIVMGGAVVCRGRRSSSSRAA
jgi:hypothetical protein